MPGDGFSGTYALKAVDWEERLGLGMETSRGNNWHAAATAACWRGSATAS